MPGENMAKSGPRCYQIARTLILLYVKSTRLITIVIADIVQKVVNRCSIQLENGNTDLCSEHDNKYGAENADNDSNDREHNRCFSTRASMLRKSGSAALCDNYTARHDHHAIRFTIRYDTQRRIYVSSKADEEPA